METQIKLINVRDVVGQRNGMAKLLGAVRRAVSKFGVALLSAGDGGPLSDLTVITSLFTFGFEFKKYDEGGPVGVQTLQKRCFQIGYERLRLDTVVESQEDGDGKMELFLPSSLNAMMHSATDDAVVVHHTAGSNETPMITLAFQTKDANEVSRAFRIFHSYIRWWQWRHCVEKGAKTDALVEKVVLCSPFAPLLPAEVSRVRFEGAERMFPFCDETKGTIQSSANEQNGESASTKFLCFQRETWNDAVCDVEALVLSPLVLFDRYESYRTGRKEWKSTFPDRVANPFEAHYGAFAPHEHKPNIQLAFIRESADERIIVDENNVLFAKPEMTFGGNIKD